MARSALEHGRESREEYRAGERLVEATVAPLRNAGRGGVRGAVLTLHDVTVREQLERARRTAERLRAFADLSATIAHELRNPLASIRGAAQELATTRPEDADERTLLSVLVREADRLDRIIRDFLDYASERALELRRVSVGDLLEEVAVLLRARVSEQTNEAISIRCEADAGAVAQLDLDRMKQVLLNLGINALEAIGGQGHVVLRARREEAQDDGKGRVCIEVEDDGPGIPPDVQERIFDPYFTTKPGGTGMGLAIVERIVRAHGGEISVHSRPGRGTTFRIRLPASP
jgi:signal transduction histidine kinase